MVVSRLLAGCRVDASASRPLDSASAATSAYQCPAASCPLAHFFPLASVCWLVIVSPLVARLHLASPFVAQPPLASILDPPSSLVPAGCCVALHLVAPPPPLDVPPAHVLPLAAPSPYIRQLALSCTAIFVTPSLGAAAIAGILKCMAHSPGGGIANGHCSLSYGSRLPTRPHACRLTCSLLRHLRLQFSSAPSLAPPLSSPPLSAPRPSPASSNARRTLPAAASPTATVHPTCPPPPPHRHLYSSTIHHHCPTLVISWRKVMTRRLFCSRLTGTHK